MALILGRTSSTTPRATSKLSAALHGLYKEIQPHEPKYLTASRPQKTWFETIPKSMLQWVAGAHNPNGETVAQCYEPRFQLARTPLALKIPANPSC